MKKNLNFTPLLLALIFISCQKDVKQQINEETTLTTLSNARISATSAISLRVSVEPLNNELGQPIAQIRSDNSSEYVHGTQQVEAQILSSDGNFYMQTNTTFKAPVRTLHFPFNAARLDGKDNYRLRTTCTTWLQNMTNGEQQVMPFRVWGNVSKGALDWNMRFDNSRDMNTDNVIVTRVDANTWTIYPANVSTTPANSKITDGSGANIGDDGYDAVPFKLTLRRK